MQPKQLPKRTMRQIDSTEDTSADNTEDTSEDADAKDTPDTSEDTDEDDGDDED